MPAAAQQQELVGIAAGQHVALAHQRLQAAPDLPQHRVAKGIAVALDQRPQPIQPDAQDGGPVGRQRSAVEDRLQARSNAWRL